jgi:dienelactone hydrolase
MIKTEIIVYKEPGSNDTFEGAISWDDKLIGKRPGVLVAHAFGGQSQFDTDKTIGLAKLGYVGFAIDMYGKGRRANSPDEADELMGELNNNRTLLLNRILLSLTTLQEYKQVDKTKIGAIGFCFGGKCVLDLARSGANVKGVVSYHGVYDKPKIEYSKPIQSSVLILHGWDDPLGTPEQTVELARELTEREADWQIHAYGHTGHAFTNPKAQLPEKGIFYQESATNRAWIAMTNFFEELFK